MNKIFMIVTIYYSIRSDNYRARLKKGTDSRLFPVPFGLIEQYRQNRDQQRLVEQRRGINIIVQAVTIGVTLEWVCT